MARCGHLPLALAVMAARAAADPGLRLDVLAGQLAAAAGDEAAAGGLGVRGAGAGRLEALEYGTFTGAHDQDRAHLARAMDDFRRAGDVSGQAWAHLFASGAYARRGDLAEAVAQSEQALALFRQTGDQAGHGWALASLGICHAYLGDHDLARGLSSSQAWCSSSSQASSHSWSPP